MLGRGRTTPMPHGIAISFPGVECTVTVIIEIGVVGGFARSCRAGGITRFALLSAVGSRAKATSAMCASWG
jgi:hypothetical protein